MKKMKTSNKGVELIKRHETLKLKAYKCPAGVWTIGYGRTKDVREGMIIDNLTADEFLREDVQDAEYAVSRFVAKPLNQNQFDALVSFVFNLGATKFKNSTLLSRINNNPSDPDIRYQFSRWNKAGELVLSGLTKRRAEEADLYFSKP